MAQPTPNAMVLMLRRGQIHYESRRKPLPGEWWSENGWYCVRLPEDAEVTLHNTQSTSGGPVTVTLTWVVPDPNEKPLKDPAGREWMWTP